MDIKNSKNLDINVVELDGRLDSNTSGNLEKNIFSLLDSGEKKLIIDFKGVDYVSSAGLRVLLLTAKKLKKMDGRLYLTALSENVKEVFDIAGFTAIFNLADSKEEALKEFM